MTRPLPLLLLLVGALCGPAAAFVDDRAERQRATDVLTEKLFAVADMLTTMERHVQRLDSWDSGVRELTSRLDALESSQERVATQLAASLRQLENVTGSTEDLHTELSSLAVSQAGTAAELRTLRTDLSQSSSGVASSVTSLVDSLAAQHQDTRGACAQSGAQLSAPLAELQTAVSGAVERAERTEQALNGGLERVDSRLQETAQQLGSISEQLRLEREARLTTTTPAPTADPQQAFLNSLYRSLSKRKGEQ